MSNVINYSVYIILYYFISAKVRKINMAIVAKSENELAKIGTRC